MDSQLVTSEESFAGDGRVNRPFPDFRYSDKFEEFCPFYMSIGMTYAEFWEGDPILVRYYYKAEQQRRERRNFDAWLQAAYVYEAILDASPALVAFAKNRKPYPFRSEPISMDLDESSEAERLRNQKKIEQGREAMMLMMEEFNRKFDKEHKNEGKEEITDG